MGDKVKQSSIISRWEADSRAYERGEGMRWQAPQCETCGNYVEGDALHCKSYVHENKPRYVLLSQKECPMYVSATHLMMTVQGERQEKLYGGLFGFCVGDALGVPAEFSTREEREQDPVRELRAYGTYHQPFGTWSDDTSLTLCLVDAVNRGFSLQTLAQNFVSFYEEAAFTPHGEVFDIGSSTREAITKMSRGWEMSECGGRTETDNGNGSLMRVLPLAFCGQETEERERIRLIENVSSLTHGHDRSRLACIFYVEFARCLLRGCQKQKALDDTIDFIRNNCSDTYAGELKNFSRILSKELLDTDEREIKSSGYVLDTLEAALWVFFRENDYRETVLRAVNLGGDTDTIAAIAGGIAGIYYGVGDIPRNWLENLARKEELYRMFEQFCRVTEEGV